MILNNNVMISNTVTLAKKQLEHHASQGAKSQLSIYEVAELMDTVKGYAEIKKSNEQSIFFSFSQN